MQKLQIKIYTIYIGGSNYDSVKGESNTPLENVRIASLLGNHGCSEARETLVSSAQVTLLPSSSTADNMYTVSVWAIFCPGHAVHGQTECGVQRN
jgi:hypothetical protein